MIAIVLIRLIGWPLQRWLDFLVVLGLGLWCL
jgi:hypothetical protein